MFEHSPSLLRPSDRNSPVGQNCALKPGSANELKRPHAASLGGELFFKPLEIADQIPDLTGIQSEFGHIRVAGDNTFAERLFK